MNKLKLVVFILGIALIGLSYFPSTFPRYQTISESTDTLRPTIVGYRSYKISPGERLILEFELVSGSAYIMISSSESLLSSHFDLDENYTNHTFIRENNDEESIEYGMQMISDYAIIEVHVIVQKDMSSENFLVASILAFLGYAILFVAIILFLKEPIQNKIEREGAPTAFRILALIFLLLGFASIFISVIGVHPSLCGVGMIVIGVELLLISGRTQPYSGQL